MGTHTWTADSEILADAALELVLRWLREPKNSKWGSAFVSGLHEALDDSITESGAGGAAALALFADVIVPSCRPNDSPMMLSYVPTAPTPASKLLDVMLGATALFGSHWESGSGAIAAENAALRWISDCLGLPEQAGGCFVAGGSAANLAALVAAREHWREHTDAGTGDGRPHHRGQPAIAATAAAHSSVNGAARVMDADVIPVAADAGGRMVPESLAAILSGPEADRVFAVVATAGTTSIGAVDPLDAIATVCAEAGSRWLHVDGAYGGAAACSPRQRHRLAGIERADSVCIDPHKWLFAPYDCGAVLYREPAIATRAHAQRADYLRDTDLGGTKPGGADRESIDRGGVDPGTPVRGEWNPADLAFHLSRRPRGLPLWFSLVVHGTAAYAAAIDETFRIAAAVEDGVLRRAPELELVTERDLTILLVAKRGWDRTDYETWGREQASRGRALIQSFEWGGRPCFRLCLVNPTSSTGELDALLADLAAA